MSHRSLLKAYCDCLLHLGELKTQEPVQRIDRSKYEQCYDPYRLSGEVALE